MMDNCTKFSDLTAHLRELFKSASYSESTVKDMDFILQAFSDCMDANGLDDYSPEMGEILIRYCEETLKVCTSRVTRAKIIVSKLNRLFQGLTVKKLCGLVNQQLLSFPTAFCMFWILLFPIAVIMGIRILRSVTNGGSAAVS